MSADREEEKKRMDRLSRLSVAKPRTEKAKLPPRPNPRGGVAIPIKTFTLDMFS